MPKKIGQFVNSKLISLFTNNQEYLEINRENTPKINERLNEAKTIATIEITNYPTNATSKQYKTDLSRDWQDYTGEFTIESNTIIQTRYKCDGDEDYTIGSSKVIIDLMEKEKFYIVKDGVDCYDATGGWKYYVWGIDPKINMTSNPWTIKGYGDSYYGSNGGFYTINKINTIGFNKLNIEWECSKNYEGGFCCGLTEKPKNWESIANFWVRVGSIGVTDKCVTTVDISSSDYQGDFYIVWSILGRCNNVVEGKLYNIWLEK